MTDEYRSLTSVPFARWPIPAPLRSDDEPGAPIWSISHSPLSLGSIEAEDAPLPSDVLATPGMQRPTSTLTYDPAGSTSTQCRYTFTVSLSDVATFYEIEVGKRGKLTYSLAEMESRGWIVGLTLGELD